MELIALTISTGFVLRLLLPATILLALGTWMNRQRDQAPTARR